MNSLTNDKLASFLQCDNWAKIQALLGYQSVRLGSAFLYERPLFASWFYYYGPRINISLESLKAFLAEKKPLWLRLEPLGDIEEYHSLGKIKRTIDWQPAQTLVLDLSLSEEVLLSAMHHKTRYNIRLAEKKGVEIVWGKEYLDDFLKLMKNTTERDGFKSHPEDYYQKLLSQGDFIRLAAARYQGKIIAAGLFCFFGNTVTYLHGASADLERQVMAPYLLQWKVIQEAKQSGASYYDFYGISAKKWPGVTRFKQGFGGGIVNYPGTYDIILRPLAYRLYSGLRLIRRLF